PPRAVRDRTQQFEVPQSRPGHNFLGFSAPILKPRPRPDRYAGSVPSFILCRWRSPPWSNFRKHLLRISGTHTYRLLLLFKRRPWKRRAAIGCSASVRSGAERSRRQSVSRLRGATFVAVV